MTGIFVFDEMYESSVVGYSVLSHEYSLLELLSYYIANFLINLHTTHYLIIFARSLGFHLEYFLSFAAFDLPFVI